ncbi:MarR family transcriptional regulator [Acidaminobacter sp. JC074]|uniref:MarR family transcriptional regulator n=1 Tax=Acidaminobacter sp. JC074 TaxID=2530199 RepID=UPI001F10CEDC|nr:MarR family transcriptional regulator [Acidaminobacter sp. JC074]MCH4891111.1 MarR family transcriptional regulator [Acidaminobacter sp. JC074]
MTFLDSYEKELRLFVQSLNGYVSYHKKQVDYGNNTPISISEIQIIERILDDKDVILTDLAIKIGVSLAAVSKSIIKLEKRGLVERYKLPTNKKEKKIKVTTLGEETYKLYQEFTYINYFKKVFEKIDSASEKEKEVLHDFFQTLVDFTENYEEQLEKFRTKKL